MQWGSPTKRSVTIAGHETSISLEPLFWQSLEQAAEAERLPVNALIARIDAGPAAIALTPQAGFCADPAAIGLQHKDGRWLLNERLDEAERIERTQDLLEQLAE